MATVSRYRRHEVGSPDGWSEWVRPLLGYRFACCDCGLVHEMEFEIGESDKGEQNVIIFRARRHNRATAAKRREGKRKQPPAPQIKIEVGPLIRPGDLVTTEWEEGKISTRRVEILK